MTSHPGLPWLILALHGREVVSPDLLTPFTFAKKLNPTVLISNKTNTVGNL